MDELIKDIKEIKETRENSLKDSLSRKNDLESSMEERMYSRKSSYEGLRINVSDDRLTISTREIEKLKRKDKG